MILTGDDVTVLVCAAVFRVDNRFQAFQCRKRLIESVVVATAAFEGLCGINPGIFSSGIRGVGGV